MKKSTILIICAILVVGGIIIMNNKDKDKDKNTNTPNTSQKEDSKKDTNKDNVVKSSLTSVALKSNKKIYAFNDKGEEKEVMDVSGYTYVAYTYVNEKLYLYLYKYNQTQNINTLGYIDLSKDNYTFNKIDNVEVEGMPNSIVVVDKDIYYTSSVSKGINKYNMDSKEVSNIEFETDGNLYLYNVVDDMIAYYDTSSYGKEPSIGLYNVTSRKKTLIADNADINFIYNQKVIYSKYGENKYSNWKYYEYSLNGKSKQISDTTSSAASLTQKYIIPVDNYYIYVNDFSLYKYANEKAEKLYTFDGGIDSITLTAKDKLNVSYGQTMDEDSKCVTLNLSTLKIEENVDYQYEQVLYLK